MERCAEMSMTTAQSGVREPIELLYLIEFNITPMVTIYLSILGADALIYNKGLMPQASHCIVRPPCMG